MSTINKEEDLSNLTLPDFSRIDLAKLAPKQPDFINAQPRGRELFGQIYFNTGHAWLGGFTAGGAYGIYEGYRKAVNPTFKVRLNSIMNSIAMRGGRVGNTLGVVGKLYSYLPLFHILLLLVLLLILLLHFLYTSVFAYGNVKAGRRLYCP